MSEKQRKNTWQVVGLVMVGALALAWVMYADQQLEERDAPEAVATLSADKVKQCRDYLELAQRTGLIKARPDPNRIDVDEAMWSALSARGKDVTLQALACDIWQTEMPPELEHVVAYGYHSGKRIQMLTSVGMSRE